MVRHRSPNLLRCLLCLLACLCSSCSNPSTETSDAPHLSTLPDIVISQPTDSVEVYDFVEITLIVHAPTVRNPFTDIFVTGKFERINHGQGLSVDGFCDSSDGTVFRVRFMPIEPGDYAYTVTYWQSNHQRVYSGTFKSISAKRRGMVAIDTKYPWHFIWKGSGEHYFLNGATAFLLMGWDDEKTITDSLDRFRSLEVNRVRVLLDGRTGRFWTEPIKPGNGFRAYVNPWVARHPDDINQPEFDYHRFNVGYWQKFERMLKYARDKDIIISVIFMGWNETPIHPVAGSEEERHYIQYMVARLASYSNVTWDIGDDLEGFRSDAWTHEIGTFLHHLDPYRHLATSHPVDNRHQDRSSSWFGMTSFQRWDRPLHGWMLEQRNRQAALGRIIPQVNEEYGFEDHYPMWAPYKAPAASAEANRRAAWEIVMAGGYQTTGETAKRGTGMGHDTGGGFVNGRGDDSMVMLKGYAHIVHFFSGFEWWKLEPHDELVGSGAFCLAEPGRLYVIYLSDGGEVTVELEPGAYEVQWFNPRSGTYSEAQIVSGSRWTSAPAADDGDWVIFLKRRGGPPTINPKEMLKSPEPMSSSGSRLR